MGISAFVKELSYRDSIRRVVRYLHLANILRKVYYLWARPRHGLLQIEVKGISARFHASTPGEFRVLDPTGAAQGERWILESFISSLHSGDVFYDIGANIGLYTVILAKVVGADGQVVAFEPGSEANGHLRDNVQANALFNVRCLQQALGDRNGHGKFFRGQENADSSLMGPPTGVYMGCELVDVVEGDRLVTAENLPLPSAVKVDVEGYEHAVLKGLSHTLRQPCCRMIFCEVHPWLLPSDVKLVDILALLKSLGFGRIDVRERKGLRKDTFQALGYKESAHDGRKMPETLASA
jgi:FkbM family methyltransferase